jgi:hypothetical protein
MSEIVSKPDHGTPIGTTEEKPVTASNDLQLFLDDLEEKLNTNLLGDQVQLSEFTVLTLPDATTEGGMIYVTDESGGAIPAFSDGSDWRRVTDRAIVS